MILTPASEFLKKVEAVPPVFEDQTSAFLRFAEAAVQQAMRSGARTIRTRMALYVNPAYLDYIDTQAPHYEYVQSTDFKGRTEALADRVCDPYELFQPGIVAVELGGYKVLRIEAEIAESTLEVAQSSSYRDYIVYVDFAFAPAKAAAE